MARALERRLRRLEARLGASGSRLVPHSEAWFAYWNEQFRVGLECARRREPCDVYMPVEILHALLIREQEEMAREAMRDADSTCFPGRAE
jgi:hypothetical protein